ncbi:N-methyl-L-tryptophan oxidase [Blastomonas fulva]|jgi:sarcosine oxidase|uniref:N-methyl-L-tryptophan oxidase n=1 Tax=Blastomonas fulva TaxID=1550728 RepID=UPI003D28D7CA
MTIKTADVIVIGLGAMGMASLYQLARRGVNVLGIDRFTPPHDHGSSHGETRITRQAIGEGQIYVPLALRSHATWRELEAITGEQLLLECGFMAIDTSGGCGLLHGKAGFIERTVAAAEAFGIAHERLGAAEVRRRHPGLNPPEDAELYYEPGGGLVFPEKCIAAQMQQAVAHGAQIRCNEPVVAITPGTRSIRVTTAAAQYDAQQVVVTAGGWTPSMVGSAPMQQLRLLRQVLHWYTPREPSDYAPGRFPTFIWTHGQTAEDSMYGFPMVPGLTPGMKVATEQYRVSMPAPDALDRQVGADEGADMFKRHLDGRLTGLSPDALRSVVCFYTQAPDGDFVIDRHPDSDRILTVSACSGHGFKHSAGVGDLVARHLCEGDALDPIFSTRRAALQA